MARASGAGKIIGVLVRCDIGEKGEGEGFFGVGGNAEGVGGNDFERRQERDEICNDERIASAAAGENQFAHARTRAREDKFLAGLRDGCGGESGRGVEQVGGADMAALGERDQAHCVLGAEFFTAGGLRRGFAEEGMGKKLVQERRNQMAAARELGIPVEAQAAAREMRGERVDDHVAGAGVEGENIARPRGGGNEAEVGDAADVQRYSTDARMAIEKIVDEGHERRALAAGGHIRGTKIGDGGDASALGNDGRLGDLQGGGDGRAEKRGWSALMVDGLAVGAEQRDTARRNAEAFAGAQRSIGEKFAKAEIKLADLARGSGRAVSETQDGGAHRGRIGKSGEVDELRARRCR